MDCFVNSKGKMTKIPQVESNPPEGEFKVPLAGYYEVLNVKGYPEAIWDFKVKDWVGVGEPVKIQSKTLTTEEKAMDLLKVIAFSIMNNDELLKSFGIEPRQSE